MEPEVEPLLLRVLLAALRSRSVTVREDLRELWDLLDKKGGRK